MRVLVACEESQEVCKAFRSKGHVAYSCDIIPCSGGHPEWHIMNDVRDVLDDNWDMILAFPPCTYLTVTGNSWFDIDKYGDKAIMRHKLRSDAIDFFMLFVNSKCDKVAIENPVGVMSTVYRKPDQYIQPYHFGHPERKKTCLWLKGLPLLLPTCIVEPNIVKYKNGKGTDSVWHINTINLPPAERSIARSKTFSGVAAAMADQWG